MGEYLRRSYDIGLELGVNFITRFEKSERAFSMRGGNFSFAKFFFIYFVY